MNISSAGVGIVHKKLCLSRNRKGVLESESLKLESPQDQTCQLSRVSRESHGFSHFLQSHGRGNSCSRVLKSATPTSTVHSSGLSPT